MLEVGRIRIEGFTCPFDLAQVGVPAGLILANLAFLLTSRATNSGAFINWGWRIPFLSVVLLGLALFVQRHVEDPEVFRRQKAEGTGTSPILEALRRYPSQIALAAGAFIAVNATLYVLVTFVIAYGSSAGVLSGEITTFSVPASIDLDRCSTCGLELERDSSGRGTGASFGVALTGGTTPR